MKKSISLLILFITTIPVINSQTMNNPNTNTSLVSVENLQLTQDWDKVFPKSDKVDHKKVTFVNRYANHTDLYDNLEKIPFNQIATFFNTWFNKGATEK